jgi:hypothetical protein
MKLLGVKNPPLSNGQLFSVSDVKMAITMRSTGVFIVGISQFERAGSLI